MRLWGCMCPTTADLGGHTQKGDIHHSDTWMLWGEKKIVCMYMRVYQTLLLQYYYYYYSPNTSVCSEVVLAIVLKLCIHVYITFILNCSNWNCQLVAPDLIVSHVHFLFLVKNWCSLLALYQPLHIIMSGRQLSTVVIVGPSVYLLTRKDSLCYNRLISLPLRTLISSQLKIETIRAVGGATFLVLQHACHSPSPPQTAVTLTGVVSNRMRRLWKMMNRQAFMAYHSTISSSICLFSVGEMLHFICLWLSFCEHNQENEKLDSWKMRDSKQKKRLQWVWKSEEWDSKTRQINVWQILIVQLNNLNP